MGLDSKWAIDDKQDTIEANRGSGREVKKHPKKEAKESTKGNSDLDSRWAVSDKQIENHPIETTKRDKTNMPGPKVGHNKRKDQNELLARLAPLESPKASKGKKERNKEPHKERQTLHRNNRRAQGLDNPDHNAQDPRAFNHMSTDAQNFASRLGLGPEKGRNKHGKNKLKLTKKTQGPQDQPRKQLDQKEQQLQDELQKKEMEEFFKSVENSELSWADWDE